MSYIDREEYEEHYGERVGYCRRHYSTVVDNYCPSCDVDFAYTEYISVCCTDSPLGELDISDSGVIGVCSHCHKNTSFEFLELE